jgi:hypothetical protein
MFLQEMDMKIYGRLKCISFSCPISFPVHLLSNSWDHEKHMLVKDHGTKWRNYMSYIFKVFKGRNFFFYKQVIVIIIIKKKTNFKIELKMFCNLIQGTTRSSLSLIH